MKKTLILLSLVLFAGLQLGFKGNQKDLSDSTLISNFSIENFDLPAEEIEENDIYLLRNLEISVNTKERSAQILQDSLRILDSLILEGGRASSRFSPALTKSIVRKEVIRDSFNIISKDLDSLKTKISNLKK